MPTYEFACRSCHTEFEARVARVGARPDACPSCGGAELEKLLSTFAARTSDGASGASAASGMGACGMGAACGRVTGRGCGN